MYFFGVRKFTHRNEICPMLPVHGGAEGQVVLLMRCTFDYPLQLLPSAAARDFLGVSCAQIVQ